MPLPLGFVPPCLPTRAPRPPTGEAWLHDFKHDGFRVIARKDHARVFALNHAKRMRYTTISLENLSIEVAQWPLAKRLEVGDEIERCMAYLAGLLTVVRVKPAC